MWSLVIVEMCELDCGVELDKKIVCSSVVESMGLAVDGAGGGCICAATCWVFRIVGEVVLEVVGGPWG